MHRLAEVGEVVFQILLGTDLQKEFPLVVGYVFIPFLAFAVVNAEFTHIALSGRMRLGAKDRRGEYQPYPILLTLLTTIIKLILHLIKLFLGPPL